MLTKRNLLGGVLSCGVIHYDAVEERQCGRVSP